MQLLLENGADPNFLNDEGLTPLFYINKFNESVIRLLFQYGADPYIKNDEDKTVLEYIYEETCSNSNSNGRTNFINVLLEYQYKFTVNELSILMQENYHDFVEEYYFLRHNHKLMMKQIKQVNSFHLRPTSLRTKIHLLQMNLSNKNYSKLEELSEYQVVIDYLGAVSVDHLKEKLKQ